MNKDHNNTTNITNPAPIILFVYNRPWHTKQKIEALQKNELADQSDLIIYSVELNIIGFVYVCRLHRTRSMYNLFGKD